MQKQITTEELNKMLPKQDKATCFANAYLEAYHSPSSESDDFQAAMNKAVLKACVAVILLVIIVALTNSATAPERDGFNVLEKHETYMIVEKDGQKYMANDVGVYTHKWTYTPID